MWPHDLAKIRRPRSSRSRIGVDGLRAQFEPVSASVVRSVSWPHHPANAWPHDPANRHGGSCTSCPAGTAPGCLNECIPVVGIGEPCGVAEEMVFGSVTTISRLCYFNGICDPLHSRCEGDRCVPALP